MSLRLILLVLKNKKSVYHVQLASLRPPSRRYKYRQNMFLFAEEFHWKRGRNRYKKAVAFGADKSLGDFLTFSASCLRSARLDARLASERPSGTQA